MRPGAGPYDAGMSDRLYFRQLLSGLDLAEDDRVAQQMVNFIYLIGDRDTGEAVVVDPAYDPQALVDVAAADGMTLVGALATHYHPDHVGVPADALATHTSGDTVQVGEIPITLIHTPGHTPGSQCFLVDGRLVAGDTLFLDGCGRTDLPGGDPAEMYESLTQRLAKVPDDAVLFPGHLYSEKPSASMAETRSRNVVFRPQSVEQFLMMFGR